jgi:hypothetical protein
VSIATEAVNILRRWADRSPSPGGPLSPGRTPGFPGPVGAAGQAESALAAARSAATEYQVLAAADPVVLWPELAEALNAPDNRLSTLNRWIDTVSHRKKALRIGRVLARCLRGRADWLARCEGQARAW